MQYYGTIKGHINHIPTTIENGSIATQIMPFVVYFNYLVCVIKLAAVGRMPNKIFLSQLSGGNVARTDADINLVANKSYTSTVTVDNSMDYWAYDKIENSTKLPTLPRVQQQQDVEVVMPNQAYNKTMPVSGSVDTDQNNYVVLSGHQQQDHMKITQNVAYDIKTTIIPVQPNQCYGTKTPSVKPNHLYATPVEPTQCYKTRSEDPNHPYATPVEPTQSYSSKICSVDSNHLYATVDEEDVTCTSEGPTSEDYDYVTEYSEYHETYPHQYSYQ